MLINGIDLSSLGIQLYDRVLNSNTVDTKQDWLDGDIQPTYIRQQERFRPVQLAFLVLGQNEEDAFIKISKLTQLLKTSCVSFDDINLTFNLTMKGEASTERLKNGNFIVRYNFTSDYAKGEREVYTTNQRLTDSTRLTILYYRDSTTLIATDVITLRNAAFKGTGDTLASIGIDVNKYKMDYYEDGVATNLRGVDLTFENLANIRAVIINYEPTRYTITLSYLMNDGGGYYNQLLEQDFSFTAKQVQDARTIGQLINLKEYKPNGYKASVIFEDELTVENLLLASPIQIYYDKIQSEQQKTVVVNYSVEKDDGSFEVVNHSVVVVKQGDIADGMTLQDIINPNLYIPNIRYFNTGYIENHNLQDLISYDTIELNYDVKYSKKPLNIYIEYYNGEYPNWLRINSDVLTLTYQDKYEDSFNLIEDLNLNLDKYKSTFYESGVMLKAEEILTFDDLVNRSVLQVYYKPINYPITVRYYEHGETDTPISETIEINDLMFVGEPTLGEIIPLNKHKTDGYQVDLSLLYNGEVSLSALLNASPFEVIYIPVSQDRSKNIIVRYKQELASAYSTINTSLITINESEAIGGVRLNQLIDLNRYKPEYYDDGFIDGGIGSTLFTFEELGSSYDVIYLAKTYETPVRYYNNTISDENWVGSDVISYRVIDFTDETTLFDLGLNLNRYKNINAENGVVDYQGLVSFGALVGLEALNVIYTLKEDAGEPQDYEYPHRFLFLEHNDMGSADLNALHPEWTLNNAGINTGVSVADPSKLSIQMEVELVHPDQPMSATNPKYGYLFGAARYSENRGITSAFFMRYHNRNLTATGTSTRILDNMYEACAGGGIGELPDFRDGNYESSVVRQESGGPEQIIADFANHNGVAIVESEARSFSENSGIYTVDIPNKESRAVFTYSYPITASSSNLGCPIYLFCNATNGSPQKHTGISNVGIYSCKIYYDGQLVRDFIPVQFYDKIGDKVAPSNCLYDKITGLFFEDYTGKNSFNIRDDTRYVDTNLAHKIGSYVVNYYKGSELINSIQYWMRGDEFKTAYELDLYERFQVDRYQPAYYHNGKVMVDDDFIVSFDNLNGRTFNVIYEERPTAISVNYWKEDKPGVRTLLKEETITLLERDFYQVPSFGDIVRINKYKPPGYETDFEYTGRRVSLPRVVEGSPYDIVYHPIDEEIKVYTTTIKFKKKVYGIRTYEPVGEYTVSLDQSDFRDGEYIDFYVDKNRFKPEKYYLDGQTFEWYEMDERLDKPEDLKESYEIVYQAAPIYVPVEYFRDEIGEDHLIASDTFTFRIDEFEDKVQLVDYMPNEWFNRYKPVSCSGGRLYEPERWYSVDELAELDSIKFIYDSLVEPHDPASQDYEQKVLYFGDIWSHEGFAGYGTYWGGVRTTENPNAGQRHLYKDEHGVEHYLYEGETMPNIENFMARIPFINLGYTPKELGRLRVEITGIAESYGLASGDMEHEQLNIMGSSVQSASQDFQYTTWFGYYGGRNGNNPVGMTVDNQHYNLSMNEPTDTPSMSPTSMGHFFLRTRVQQASGWVYAQSGPTYIDGRTAFSTRAGIIYEGQGPTPYCGIGAFYRRGDKYMLNDNYEQFIAFNDYGIWDRMAYNTNQWFGCFGRQGIMGEDITSSQIYSSCGCNPYNITMDAWNGYFELSTYGASNHPWVSIVKNTDQPVWEGIERPKCPLYLFATANPTTGKVNYLPFNQVVHPGISGTPETPFAWQASAMGNPYTWNPDEHQGQEWGVVYREQMVSTGQTDEQGNVIYRQTTTRIPILYTKFEMVQYPYLCAAAVWRIKVYDRDKLVRDMIPVAEGDRVFGYTAPATGLFDLITEIFFDASAANEQLGWWFASEQSVIGGLNPTSGTQVSRYRSEIKLSNVYGQPRQRYISSIIPLQCIPDPLTIGKITANYYDYDNSFITNQYVDVPAWYASANEKLENILKFNDYKPDDFHLDGLIDLDKDLSFQKMSLLEIYQLGTVNLYYKLRTFTKTIVYYRGNSRIASKDLFVSLEDIKKATTLKELGVEEDLYYTEEFAHGKIMFDNTIIASDDLASFIDAPSPIVVYDKLTKEENPDLLYVEYYRGGAYDDTLITPDPESPNYLSCNLDGVVLNPNGAIKYYNHYHTALYEDETMDYFIPYQVKVVNKYAGIHRGPARRYQTLAMIIVKDTYTIIEERNGWGRLKEYPVGWIMLSQTEPITGPGQNPDYDIADQETATIPFAKRVHISKLTIDRLWCYIPEQESWVKAEDLSYDQAGKLYNALGIDVIHLDKLDFNNINSLVDMGIDIDKKLLRFHNHSSYQYNGEYTKNAFSDLHSIEIVYPETIYNYTCIYYKDNKTDKNEIGRAAFSCSISDWNPDWDTFIETSWQTLEDGTPLSPKIYRDTELTLSWDYFGFDKNLFRPAGYPEGIYMWNPRSWDPDNIRFSFEEMVRTGTQYVFYPTIAPGTYKILIDRNKIGWYYGTNQVQQPYYNYGIGLVLGTDTMTEYGIWSGADSSTLQADIDIRGELLDEGSTGNGRYKDSLATIATWGVNNDRYAGRGSVSRNSSGSDWPSINLWLGPNRGGLSQPPKPPIYEITPKTGFGYAINISNYRNTATAVFGLKDVYGGDNKYHYFAEVYNTDTGKTTVDEITSTYNVKNGYTPLADTSYTYRTSSSGINFTQDSISLSNKKMFSGIFHSIRVYQSFMLVHYWIAMPKGAWYTFNGVELQMPDNGLYDICSGEFVRSYRLGDSTFVSQNSTNAYTDLSVSANNVHMTDDGKDYIFLMNQNPNDYNEYYYFQNWVYNKTSTRGLLITTDKVQTYDQPDTLARKKSEWVKDLVVPYSYYSSDNANKVYGIWYQSGDRWFKGNLNMAAYSGGMDRTKVVDNQEQVCLLPGNKYSQMYAYLDPSTVSTVGEQSAISYGNAPKVITVYNSYNNQYYFDGNFWIPKAYTSLITTPHNKEYVIQRDTPYYSVPIEDDNYKVNTYLYGTRINIPYVATNDTNWGWTGYGWIKIEGNTSIVL